MTVDFEVLFASHVNTTIMLELQLGKQSSTLPSFLADPTVTHKFSMIDYWNHCHLSVCLSLCPSVCDVVHCSTQGKKQGVES